MVAERPAETAHRSDDRAAARQACGDAAVQERLDRDVMEEVGLQATVEPHECEQCPELVPRAPTVLDERDRMQGESGVTDPVEVLLVLVRRRDVDLVPGVPGGEREGEPVRHEEAGDVDHVEEPHAHRASSDQSRR